jgi:hypothetical protein
MVLAPNAGRRYLCPARHLVRSKSVRMIASDNPGVMHRNNTLRRAKNIKSLRGNKLGQGMTYASHAV